MSILEQCKKLRRQIFNNRSGVTSEHIIAEENKKFHEIQEQTKGYNLVRIPPVTSREITNGDDKYTVTDSSYEYNHRHSNQDRDGRYIYDDDISHREITVSQGDKKQTLSFHRQVTEHNYFTYTGIEGYKQEPKFKTNDLTIKLNDKEISFPKEAAPRLDFNDINAVRYQFRNNKDVSDFLDKYVIVKPEEKTAYKKYEQKQDSIMQEMLLQKKGNQKK